MPPKVWPYRLLAALLILGTAILRIVYLASDCPLDLSPDEAHYWDWSRHLDWSYYSKGPLVAWLIRLSCELFGPWSIALTGTEMLAVRLPAVVCGGLLLLSLYVLTFQVFRKDSLALAVVALALTLPMLAAGASLMTIDAPYICCWGWALVLGNRAVFRNSTGAWAGAGLLVGMGILAKYTMVLWIPSIGLFLLCNRSHRSLLVRPGFWLLTLIAGFCCLPLLMWNAQHDWLTLRHVSGHAGLQEESAIHWLGPFAYLGLQFLVLMGYWLAVWAIAMIVHRPGTESRPEVNYLWWMSAPMFLFFFLFSFKNGGGEANWPGTAYISGMVLAAGWLANHLQTASVLYRRWTLAGVLSVGALGLVLSVVIHDSTPVQPILLKITGPASPERPMPLRRVDPTCRLRGWRTLAAAVDALRAELRAKGIEPVLAGDRWTLPGELGFYCQGQPQVYCLGLVLGDRHSQYDLWEPNPLNQPQDFAGRTFIIVDVDGDALANAFTHLEPLRQVTHFERGQPIAHWQIRIGHGYRGFGKLTMKNSSY